MNYNNRLNRRFALVGIGYIAINNIAFPVLAQTTNPWPARPIKWIVSQPAGAGPDILAGHGLVVWAKTGNAILLIAI